MSETIQGSKSLLYSKSDIPGIPGTGDSMQHLSVQEVSGKRGAADTVIHGTTVVSTAHAIEAGSVKKKIVSTAHGAKRGWVMRPSTGNSSSDEIIITEIIDANTFAISYEADLAIADTFSLLKFITPNYTSTGDLNVVVSGSGPTMYNLDGNPVEVSEDTAVPANNLALPSKMFIEIDGVTYPVRIDTGTPANTVAIPVQLSGVAGPVNITAGDLNVQLTDQGPNADVTRIGDGTNQLGINASNEGLVHDADNLVQTTATKVAVESIDIKTPALGQALEAASVPVVLTAAQITTLTPPSAITGFALETTQLAGNVLTGAVTETAPATDTASSGLNGRLQRIAQRLTSLISLLPSSIGQKVMADSLSVTMASDQAAISVSLVPQATTYVQSITLDGATAQTFTAPANARNLKIHAGAENTINLNVAVGGVTATSVVGQTFEPARSEDYVGVSTVSVICVAAATNHKISLIWSV